MKRYTPYFAGIGFATIFGFSFIFTRDALNYIAPFHLLGLRFATAISVMTILNLAGIININVKLTDFKVLLPLALFQPIIYFSTETIGLLLTSASQAGMMIALIPIFVAIFAAFILKEHPTNLQIPFIISSVGGVLFIVSLENKNGLSGNLLGSFLLLAAVISASCYNIASRKASRNYKPIEITWVMMIVGAIAFNSIAIIQHFINGNLTEYFKPLTIVWPAIIYLGILSSIVAFFLINYSLAKLTAAQSAVFANLVTVIAIAGGVVFLDESFYWYHAIGAIFILTGVWGTNKFAETESSNKELNEVA